MSSVVSSIFGGGSGGGEQASVNQEVRGILTADARRAQANAVDLFNTAGQNRNLGFQGALDVFGQAAPQQVSTFQQGNINAQDILLAGFPQFQNAILGGQVDLSGLAPRQVTFDPSFLNQTLPDFAQSSPSFRRPAPRADLASLLSGATDNRVRTPRDSQRS